MFRRTLVATLLAALAAHAQDVPPAEGTADAGTAPTAPVTPEPKAEQAASTAPAPITWPSSFTFGPGITVSPVAYVEADYSFNFNQPSNGVTNFRGFDNRHNSFTLQNVALGGAITGGPLGAKLVLQVGHTPSTYYLAEPAAAGAGGANASDANLWKYVQEAFVTYKAPLGNGILLQLGLCASPIGLEVIPVKDNWNWSRSDLFFGLPFYHVGLRATYEWTDRLSTTVSLFNGWNSVVDNNDGKSVQANVTYKIPDTFYVTLLYFGGPERAKGAPEGQHWRHHFDLTTQVDPTRWLTFAGQGDVGWESTNLGLSYWVAGAVYARVHPLDWLAFTVRGDVFHEKLGSSSEGTASAIFWSGAELIGSITGTVDVRPHPNLSLRLEYRHDLASAPLFFSGAVDGDGSAATPYVPNAQSQDTLLLGVTTWF